MLYRGDFQIPWGCQFRPYDPYEKVILEAAGTTIHGRMGRPQDRALFGGYDYFLFKPAPEIGTTSWTAFHSLSELQQFLDAYGLTLDSVPNEGTSFTVSIPAVPRLEPLRHVSTEILKDDTGLSLRVAKLGDEPGSLAMFAGLSASSRSRRLMAIELWDGEKQVASYSPFTLPAAPSISADPDDLSEEEAMLALNVLIGTLPWGAQWASTGGYSALVLRVFAMVESARPAETGDPSPNRPRG